MAPKLAPLPSPAIAWVDQNGRPTLPLTQYMAALSKANIGPLISAANDAEASKSGVPVNGLYQSNGSVRIRLA